jgi:hypothetical protein
MFYAHCQLRIFRAFGQYIAKKEPLARIVSAQYLAPQLKTELQIPNGCKTFYTHHQ